jgi:hypothetical protein
MTISRRGPNLKKGAPRIKHKMKRFKMKFTEDFVRPSDTKKDKDKGRARRNRSDDPKLIDPKPNLFDPNEVRKRFSCVFVLALLLIPFFLNPT